MFKFLKKYKFSKSQVKIFEEYTLVNQDIMQLVNDIEHLKEVDDFDSIKILEAAKKKLEKMVVELEKNFYDVKKGLWIGVAQDLESDDYKQFLLYLPWKNLHNHVEVFGTSGFGKSRLMAIILRQLIAFGWSLMCMDPKGGQKQEIAQWIYDFAAAANRHHTVSRIMPTYPEISDKGNIIFGLSDEEIGSMCSSMTVSGTGTASSDEQYYSNTVYRIVIGILQGMSFLEKVSYSQKEIDRKIKKEVEKYHSFKNHGGLDIRYEDETILIPDPVEIGNLFDKKNIQEIDRDHNANYLISPFDRTLVTFRELSFYSNFNRLTELTELVRVYPIPKQKTQQLEQQLYDMKETALRTLSDIVSLDKAFFEKTGSSLSILLSMLSYGPIGEILCGTRINPLVQKIREEEGAIVIFQPAPMRFSKVSEILVKCYMNMYLSLFGTIGASGRGLHKRVALVIDEAKPMIFPGVEEIYNKSRELGMSIFALYQSQSDIIFKLGQVLADIVRDNTGTTIYMKQTSESSRVAAASRTGTKKVSINVNMKENEGMDGRSTVITEDRELVTSSDMDKLGIGEAIIIHGGKKYFCIFPYQEDPMPINVTMPELKSEILYNKLTAFEQELKNVMTRIDSYNIEKKEENERNTETKKYL